MPHPRLDRPPIVEALLDFRVRASVDGEAAAENLDRTAEALRGSFPEELGSDLDQLPEELRARLPRELFWERGKRFRSADGRRTLLVSTERLTFSCTYRPLTEPYSEWAELEEAAFAAWEIYQESLQPQFLVALATRFVNRIEVPGHEPTTIFQTPPDLPIEDVTLTSFNDRRSGVTADGYGVRTGRRLPSRPEEGPAILFFDVEAFRRYEPGPTPPIRRDTLAQDLTRLHALKNDLFFGSIQPEALNRYRDDRP